MPHQRYITDIRKIDRIPEQARASLLKVTEQFAFRVNEYYLNLIDWNDPNDPLRKLVIPHESELAEYGLWDTSSEEENYVAPGCQHKYASTALLLVSEVCGAYCRYCFRKRLFRADVHETTFDIDQGLAYIRQHPEISNVLLTGGDPLVLATARLYKIIRCLREIEHVHVIRIGSKLPAFDPMRIYEDDALLNMFRQFSEPRRRIYVMTHMTHPREITTEALRGFDALLQAGVILTNQTPVLRGVNDDADILAELLHRLSAAGVTPYYFFINRPVIGNADFVLPLKWLYDLVEQAKSRTSGLGKRVRLVMSHAIGKIEILAIEHDTAYLKLHQSRYGDYGKMIILPCPNDVTWFDDLPGSEKFLTPDSH